MLKWFFERACVFYGSCGKIGVMEGSNNTVRRERSYRGLIGVLVGLSVVIVGLVVAVVIVGLSGGGAESSGYTGDDEATSSDNSAIECYYNFGDVVDCENLMVKLEEVSEESGSDSNVDSIVKLASLYSRDNSDKAIELLERALDKQISDQKRYEILMMLSSLYQERGAHEKVIETKRRIVSLPDEMILEYEDWGDIKKQITSELSREEENV